MEYSLIEKYSNELDKGTQDFKGRESIKADIKEFTEALIINNVVIVLELDNCKLGEEEMKVLVKGFNKKESITTLYFGGNHIGNIGAKYFADGIKENKTLILIDLSENKIGNNGAKYICILKK